MRKSAENHFLRKSAQKVRFAALFGTLLESAETPLFVQINVFAVWALRLDRKYTSFCRNPKGTFPSELPCEFWRGSLEAFFLAKTIKKTFNPKSLANFGSMLRSFATESALEGSVRDFVCTLRTNNGFTVVAGIIAELTCFEPEVCICKGHYLEFKRESVSAKRDFL